MQLTVRIYEQMHKLTVMIPTQHKLLMLATENTSICGFLTKTICRYGTLLPLCFFMENYQQYVGYILLYMY